jgi:hypothetical protein
MERNNLSIVISGFSQKIPQPNFTEKKNILISFQRIGKNIRRIQFFNKKVNFCV